ncbi:MAG: DUF11 domain-containing protein, partial [Thermoplasmata archaeon]|nr:DUF11 domain-containing protein [Thermoplasmata archaeon]
ENVGTDAAYNVVVTEYYPAGILYSTANPLPDIGQSIWLIGLIPAGSSVVIDITVTVDPGALGVVMNHGVANYTSSIGIYQPEVHDFVNTTILGPIMEITKAASPYANVGEQAIYWINYTNTGTDIAYNVTITETYPSGMTFDSAIPAPDIGDNVWLVGTVAPGGSGTIQITVDVIGPLPGQYVNLAELDYENAIGLDYPTISDTAITAIGNMPYMTVSKIGQAQANAGEEVMFTITYTNVGNVTAYFVNITDTYPFGLEFNTSVPLPTTGDGFWEIGTVLPGASATIIVYMNVTGDVYGILSNVVNISYESLAGEFFEEFIIWDIEIVDAFIDIDKTAPVTAVDGSTVTYTITYQNTGTDTAYNFTIIEAYPPDSTFISAVPVPTTGTNIWELGDLAPGASGTILIDITLSAATTFIQTNYANASWNNTIDVMSWANATATTTIEDSPEAIMVVEKWANATVNPGGTITYIINYTNLGAGAAINFWLNETFDIGTAWDGSGVPPTVGNNWLIGGVPGNSNGTLFINVSVGIGVLPGTILTNIVDFEYNDQSVLQTGSASANTLVVNPDVTITKTGPAVIYSGQVISYTITYQNNGDDYAYNLNITDTFPADIAYTGSIPAPDFGAPGSPACTWLINSVPPGGIGTIIVNGLVNALAPVDTVLENYVWLNYTNAAGAGFSDQDMVTTVVVGDIVTLDKTGPLTADPGETIFYNISYNNEATSAGPVNIVITEFYDNVTFVGSVPVPSNPGAGDNIWIIPNVAPDSGGIITITVTVNNTAPDIITNQVMLSYITGTTDVFLNATATTVISGPLMEITKTGPDDAVPGNTIMYTITYTNVGAGFANNVTITEIYPSMTSFNFALPAPNPGTDNVWTLGAIAPGDSFTIRIWVDISASAFGTLTNWAELTYQNMSGGSLPSEWASAATVLTGPTLTLVKSGPDTINSGQQITYTLTYNNIGRADASDVILEDAYPAGLVYVSSSDGGI